MAFEAPAVVRRGSALELCTPYGTVRFFEGGWEVERGSSEDECSGEVVLVKVREVGGGVVVKYVDGKIYAVALWDGGFPDVAVATSESELPGWARF